MKPATRWWMAGGTLVAVALVAWALAPRPVAVEVATASRGPFELAIVEDGRTRLRERHVVSAPLAGRLARITLREGDAVAAGDLVAQLQPLPSPMLDARTRAELQARREGAAAGVARAAALVGQQKVALAQAQSDFKRSEQLAQQAFIAPTKLDADRLAVQSAQQALEAALQTRHVAEHELSVAQAALGAQAATGAAAGAPFQLRAPVAGRVLKVLQESEGSVALGTPLLALGDTGALEIVAELLTPDALQVPAGAPVRIERWGGPGVLQGRVRRVEPGGFTKVSALGVEEQRVNVLIDLTSPRATWAALGDGYRVGVHILREVQTDVLRVPVSAVFPQPGQPTGSAVFLLAEGRARLQAVALGGRNAEWAWISQGLKAGDTVIVYPPAAVADGVRAKARAASAE